MTLDPVSAHPPSGARKRKASRSQLKVVLDTNSLYVTPTSIGSASDLVRQEIVNLIVEAKYPDLEVVWYIPEIVRHERQYQMQAEALKLRGAINKIERLLSHNLALTDPILLDHVNRKIEEKEKELGLQEIALDHKLVNWEALIDAAAYRKPPFEPGEKEKGFRDALVAESFFQLLEASPRTPALCRLALITSDGRLAEAVSKRLEGVTNASVLADIEELKGLINTIVSNVAEEFIAQLKPKADKIFFVSSSAKDTVFYKENLRDKISEKFKSELAATPTGTTFRKNGTWFISPPNFSRKEGKRIFWISRIGVEVDAGNISKQTESAKVYVSGLNPSPTTKAYLSGLNPSPAITEDYANLNLKGLSEMTSYYQPEQWSLIDAPTEKPIITHNGRDKYDVVWSTEVTMSKELKKPLIEDIKHIEMTVQPVS